jgi:hypothetical protein
MVDCYKFRGWDATGQKGWVYGDLTHTKKVLKEEPFLENRVMVGGYEVVPESVGLWTGLKDYDGEDIYEDDIISIQYPDQKLIRPVEFKDGAFMVTNSLISIPLNTYTISKDLFERHKIKVVGNLFEKKRNMEGLVF